MGALLVTYCGGVGVSVLVCIREQHLRWIGSGLACLSGHYNNKGHNEHVM